MARPLRLLPTASPLRSAIVARRPRRRPNALQWALLASVLVHAGLLTLRFVDPERFERIFRDLPLEVVLVNAHGDEAPTRPQAVAQASLAGGGEAGAGRATSPLPAERALQIGDASDDPRRHAEATPNESMLQLVARLQRELSALPPPDPSQVAGQQEARDIVERRRQLLDQLAEIERRINQDNAQPKRRYVGPATREVPYALYYDHLRRRIEERGTRDFPSAEGRRLYGELTVNMTIDARGRLIDAEVLDPSGSPALDRQALAIVRAASPFGPFSAQMRRQADQIVVTSRFRFTHGDSVEATVGIGQ
jgi:protein TonB